jgi:hypothetical protein
MDSMVISDAAKSTTTSCEGSGTGNNAADLGNGDMTITFKVSKALEKTDSFKLTLYAYSMVTDTSIDLIDSTDTTQVPDVTLSDGENTIDVDNFESANDKVSIKLKIKDGPNVDICATGASSSKQPDAK